MLQPIRSTDTFSPSQSLSSPAQTHLDHSGPADFTVSTLVKTIDPAAHMKDLCGPSFSPPTFIHQCIKSLMSLSNGASTVFRAHRQAEIRDLMTALRTRDDGHIQYVYYRLHHSTREIITAGNPGLFARYLFMTPSAEKQRLKNDLIARSDRAYLFQQMLHPFDLAAGALRTARSIANSLAQIASSVPQFFSQNNSSETVDYDDSPEERAEPITTTSDPAPTRTEPREEEPSVRVPSLSRFDDFLATFRRTRDAARARVPTTPRSTASAPTRTAPTSARPTVPGAEVYVSTAIPNAVEDKRREIIELRTRFDALQNQPQVPEEFFCPVSLEMMALPVFSVAHPAIQDALNLANGTERDTRLANRALRHTLDSVSLEEMLPNGRNRVNCQNCRHPVTRADVRIDTVLQDEILAFLRQHAR